MSVAYYVDLSVYCDGIRCAQLHGHRRSASFSMAASRADAKGKAQRANWTVGRKRALCPGCSSDQQKARSKP